MSTSMSGDSVMRRLSVQVGGGGGNGGYSAMSPADMTSPSSSGSSNGGSSASTPSSVCSPRPTSTPHNTSSGGCMVLAPKLAAHPSTPKPLLQEGAVDEGYNMSMASSGIVTQKEWVVPPRPKPGRKPATDTPPTKRKAQNRAAQRAFRERRAARVNELEDKIKEIEAAHAAELAEARLEVERLRESSSGVYAENNNLRAEVERLNADVAGLREKEKQYEEEIDRLRRRRRRSTSREGDTVQQVASPPSEAEGPGELPAQSVVSTPTQQQEIQVVTAPVVTTIQISALSVPLPPRRSLRKRGGCGGGAAPSSAQISSSETPARAGGGCMKGSNAVCPCMANKASPKPPTTNTSPSSCSPWPSEVLIHPLPKRPTSPPTCSSSNKHPQQKRTRLNPTLPASSSVDELETDFTNLYALGTAAAASSAVSTPASTASATSCLMADPCGFCSDGTPCVCAEMAMMDQEDHDMDMGLASVSVNVNLSGISGGSSSNINSNIGFMGSGSGVGGAGGINMSSSWAPSRKSTYQQHPPLPPHLQNRYYNESDYHHQLSDDELDGENNDGDDDEGEDMMEGAKLAPLLMFEIDESLRIANSGLGDGGEDGSGGGSGEGRMSVMHPPNTTRPLRSQPQVSSGGGGSSGGGSSAGGGGGGGCGATNGPGTCTMCQKDPLAMRFCQSVASLRSASSSFSPAAASASSSMPPPSSKETPSGGGGGGCCGGGGRAGGCCMDPPPKPQNQPQLPHQQQKTILPPLSLAKTYIPCSAAYAKLRKHRGWDKASMDDFPGLVRPLLVDAGEGGPAGGAAGKRCPRVEVGSLQDVLTMLDRRFGKDVL